MILLVLFVLFSALVFAIQPDIKNNIAIGIDLSGILIGIALIIFIITILKSFKGTLRKAFDYMVFGISSQVLALAYTLVFLRFNLYPAPLNIDIHHLLMIIGMVFFAVGVYNLRKMMSELSKKK